MTRWLNALPVYLSDLRQITHNFFPSSFTPVNHIVVDEKMKPKMIITILHFFSLQCHNTKWC